MVILTRVTIGNTLCCSACVSGRSLYRTLTSAAHFGVVIRT